MKKLLAMPLSILRVLFQSAWLALGQIWANKTRSSLTTIGIIIGVASVIAVIGSLSGLKAKVLEDLETFGTNKIWIHARRPDKGRLSRLPWSKIRFEPEQFDDMLEHCPSVKQFSRVVWGGGQTIRHGEKSVENVRMFGVEPSWYKIDNRSIVFGRPFSVIDESQGARVCLIEPELRDELWLDRDCIGQSILMGSKTFRIVGVVESRPEMAVVNQGGSQSPSSILIPFRTSLKLMRWPWMWVEAASTSTELSEEAVAEIKFFLRRTRGLRPGQPDNFRVQAIASEIQKFNQISQTITLVAAGVVGISLLVGGVGIMNIMLVSVSERTREIGLRKAVGARKSAILTQFLVEAVVLCFMGGLVGIGFGKALTSIIAKASPVLDKTYIPVWAILVAFGFAGSVGIFFGIFPAIKAARLDPIEALRHE